MKFRSYQFAAIGPIGLLGKMDQIVDQLRGNRPGAVTDTGDGGLVAAGFAAAVDGYKFEFARNRAGCKIIRSYRRNMFIGNEKNTIASGIYSIGKLPWETAAFTGEPDIDSDVGKIIAETVSALAENDTGIISGHTTDLAASGVVQF